MTHNIINAVFLFLYLSLPLSGLAQGGKNKVKAETMDLLAKAKEEMAAKDYHQANKTFREMLELKTVLPTEMCYFFANTLFHLQQFDNSLRFVEKYESLAGASGEFSLESRKLKELLREEMKIIRECELCDSQGYLLEDCRLCRGEGNIQQSCVKCFGQKEIKCTGCSGEGVIIQKNHFGQSTYKTCQLCQGSGRSKCIFCKGAGRLVQDCQHCSGSGKSKTHELCIHPHKTN